MNKIIHGDCLEVMRSMPDETFKTIITSPPYNIGGKPKRPKPLHMDDYCDAVYGNKFFAGYGSFSDNLPHQEYVRWQKECLTEMWRLLRPDGAIFYNHRERTVNGKRVTPEEIVGDFPVRQTIVWNREGGYAQGPGIFTSWHQWIYFIPKSRAVKLDKKTRCAGNVWHMYPSKYGNPHPASFPTKLPLRCLRAMGPGPVLDPFAGSGTTGVACEMMRPKRYPYTLIEIDETYCQMARDRCAQTEPTTGLFHE